MSKTAQRKRQAYRDGYQCGRLRMNPGACLVTAVTAESFRQGLAEGRRERARVGRAMTEQKSLMSRLLRWIAKVLS